MDMMMLYGPEDQVVMDAQGRPFALSTIHATRAISSSSNSLTTPLAVTAIPRTAASSASH